MQKSKALLPLTFPMALVLLSSILWAPLAFARTSITPESAATEFLQSIVSASSASNRNLQTQNNPKHIDFTELLDPDYASADSTDSFFSLLSNALFLARDYIHAKDENGNMNINDLLQGLMDDEGYWAFDFPNGYFLDLGSGSSVTLHKAKVKGLTTVQEADLLRPTVNESEIIGGHSPGTLLQNSFFLETLVLDLYMTEVSEGGNKKETVSIRLPFSGVTAYNVPLLLALWEDGVTNFPLGAALNNTYHLVPCLRETVLDGLNVLALEATFEEIGMPSLFYNSDPDSESPFFNVVYTLFLGLPASVPIFFNSTIRDLLNNRIDSGVLQPGDDEIAVEDPCPVYPDGTSDHDETENGLIDFRAFFDKGLPAVLKDLLEDEFLAVDPDTGLPKVNEALIRPLMEDMGDEPTTNAETTSPGTSMVFGSGDEGLVDVSTNLAIGGLSADVALRVRNLTLYNLDTMIPPLELLEPVAQEPHQLNNTMTMGLDMETNPERSMGLSAEVFLSIVTEDSGSIEHNLRLQANMEALSLVLTALLEVVESRLHGFPVKDITNLQCWLATMKTPNLDATTGIRLDSESPTAGIAEIMASMAKMNLDVECLAFEGSDLSGGSACGSAGMEEWTNLMGTQEAQIAMTETMNSVLAYAASLLSDGGAILQTPIDRMLNEARLQCPHSPYYYPEADLPASYESMEALPEHEYSYEYLILWGSIALALVLAFAAMAIGMRCTVRRKHARWLAGTEISSEQKKQLSLKQKEADELEAGLNAATNSMFFSTEIPFLVRWGMPIVILGNIALFLSGHLNLGATVYIEANLAGESIKVGDFFDFAIARTTIDLWKAGGKALAILILIFSGIWPYTKQFLTLILWFLPPTKMSILKRGSFLIWLDKLAKWSMIDIFVIVVCIAAFRVSINSPELAFLPENFYSVELMVVPMWGLYSNMTAQLVSQVSSHFIIYYHRCIVTNATKTLRKVESKQETDASKIRLLWAHSFSNPHFESSEKFVPKSWVGTSILVSCICMTAFVVLGSFLPSFSVELLGLIGVAVESGQEFEEAITHHSVWSIVNMLFEEARFLDATGDYIGVGVLGSLVLATVLVVPILQALGLIYQWFIPLTQSRRRRLSVTNEILQAWQYIEVYLIALFVASWQLGPVSQYMFNAYCGSLDGFFAQMVSYGLLKQADAQCFSVQGSIDPGSIALLLAAILLALVNSVVTLASKQCLEERDNHPNEPIVAEEHPNGAKDGSRNSGSQTSGSSHLPNNGETSETTPIRPFPFVFTDGYRWLLTMTDDKNGEDDV